jgi:Tol biopolymer transport system component
MTGRLRLATVLVVLLAGATLGATPSDAAVTPSEATRVSVDSAEGQLPALSQRPAVSDDGTVIVFESFADTGLAGDSTARVKVFVRDEAAGTTNLVSITPRGGVAEATDASVSDDGTKVAFASAANDLVPGDTNNTTDIFVRDLVAGTTQRVSSTSTGGQSNGAALEPEISGDGTVVVFSSVATNLVPGDTNGRKDIFVRDLGSGTTTRVNVGPSGVQANNTSSHASVSDDGGVVAFESLATNLVTRDTNGRADVFARTGTSPVTRVSRPAGTGQANGRSAGAFVRGDGQVVVFSSVASNLVAGDTNGAEDIFRATLGTAGVTRVNLTNTDAQAGDDANHPSISDDGRLIAFDSVANNYGVSDTNGVQDVYVRDLASNTTTLASVRGPSLPGNASSFLPVLAGTAPVVVYQSNATNLADNDTNGDSDILLTQATRCDGRLVTLDLTVGGAPTAGDDVVRGTPAANTLNLANGKDRACLGAGADQVTGGGDNDRLFGDLGNDTLLGTSANDTLFGEEGADSLNGGAGTDSCLGGTGTDNAAGCESTQSIP